MSGTAKVIATYYAMQATAVLVTGGLGLLPAGLVILHGPAQFGLTAIANMFVANYLERAEYWMVNQDRDLFTGEIRDFVRDYAGPSSKVLNLDEYRHA